VGVSAPVPSVWFLQPRRADRKAGPAERVLVPDGTSVPLPFLLRPPVPLIVPRTSCSCRRRPSACAAPGLEGDGAAGTEGRAIAAAVGPAAESDRVAWTVSEPRKRQAAARVHEDRAAHDVCCLSCWEDDMGSEARVGREVLELGLPRILIDDN
jgi:hypothetical protein